MTVYFYIDYMGHKIKHPDCTKNRLMQISKGDMGYWLFAYQLAMKYNIQIIPLKIEPCNKITFVSFMWDLVLCMAFKYCNYFVLVIRKTYTSSEYNLFLVTMAIKFTFSDETFEKSVMTQEILMQCAYTG